MHTYSKTLHNKNVQVFKNQSVLKKTLSSKVIKTSIKTLSFYKVQNFHISNLYS